MILFLIFDIFDKSIFSLDSFNKCSITILSSFEIWENVFSFYKITTCQLDVLD
jgi:hypothetical protein